MDLLQFGRSGAPGELAVDPFKIGRGCVRELDPASHEVPDDSHPGAEGQAQFFLNGLHFRGASSRSGPPGAAGLDPRLRGPNRPVLCQNALSEMKLGRRRGKAQQGSCMTHGEPTRPQVFLDQLGQPEEPEGVRNRGTVLPKAPGQLLLSPAEFGQEPLVGLCCFHRIEILAKEILDEAEFECLGVARLAHDRRHARQARLLGSSPPALPHKNLVLRPSRPHDKGLKHPRRSDRGG